MLHSKHAGNEHGMSVQSASISLVISKLHPKETLIAFNILKKNSLQYVAMVLCQEKSNSVLLASSRASLHAAPV